LEEDLKKTLAPFFRCDLDQSLEEMVRYLWELRLLEPKLASEKAAAAEESSGSENAPLT
jgi:hypothetical protein